MQVWSEIFQNIKHNKLRVFLSGITVCFAIFIFIILFGISGGLQNNFKQDFTENLGASIVIESNKTVKAFRGYSIDRRINLTLEDYKFLKNKYKRYKYISVRSSSVFDFKYGHRKDSYNVKGTHRDIFPMDRIKLKTGRFFNDLDGGKNYIIIGSKIRKYFFTKEQNPINKIIFVKGIYFKVIGVFTKKEEEDEREGRAAYIPIETYLRVFTKKTYIQEILIGYDYHTSYKVLEEDEKSILKDLKRRHKIHPGDHTAIRADNISEDIKKFNQITIILTILVFFIGLGTLISGIIGIANIMVYMVRERTKEFGIRKVLGAKPFTVIKMVLLEGILITMISGYLGIFLGILVIKMLGNSLENYYITNPNVGLNTVLIATLVLILSGLVAGYIPAKRAMRIKPIVALNSK